MDQEILLEFLSVGGAITEEPSYSNLSQNCTSDPPMYTASDPFLECHS